MRRRPWRWVIALLAALAAAALAVWLLWHSPVLRLADVRVDGAAPARHETILRALDPPYNQPLVEVDMQAAADRVAATGLFRTVETDREWPSTLVVTVDPRQPVVGLRRPEGQVELVDRDGVAYETVAAPQPGLLLASVVRPGDERARRTAVAVGESLTPDLRSRLESMSVDSSARATLILEGVQVRWGTAEDGRVKAAVVEALLRSGSPAMIDVTSPLSPVSRDDRPTASPSS